MRDTCTPIADEVICGKEISKRVKCLDGSLRKPVPDPDGGRSSRPLDKRGRPLKNILSALRASVWSENKGNSRDFTTPQAITNFTWGRGCRKI